MDLKVHTHYLKLWYRASKDYATLQQLVRLQLNPKGEQLTCQP